MYVCVCVQAYLVYTSHDRGNASHDLFQGLDGTNDYVVDGHVLLCLSYLSQYQLLL